MRTFFQVVGWGLLGSLGAFVLTLLGLFIFNSVVPRAGGDELGAWGWGDFALLMLSPWVGFVPGAIYGIVRIWRAKEVEKRPS
jgi:hypothetical protein